MPALMSITTDSNKRFPFRVGFKAMGLRTWLIMDFPNKRIL
jgi:hypothetical protein